MTIYEEWNVPEPTTVAWAGETTYPIFILSKGRADRPYTIKALLRLGLQNFNVVVELHEYEQYRQTLRDLGGNPDNVKALPFSNHGKGSGPARNWCWEFAKQHGFARHWLMDDNIQEFWRLHRNKRYRIAKGVGFLRAVEEFVDRFTNVAIAGLQYKFFAADRMDYPPYILNTRIMSCMLIDNDIPFRWRGRYNEDVDLSIRVLKAGYCTMLFYAFLAGKLRTGLVKGGNTDEIYNRYQGDAAFRKSSMLKNMHPDVVTLVERYGRIHHHVDLNQIVNEVTGKPARYNAPKLKPDVPIYNTCREFGMALARNYGRDDQYIDREWLQPHYPMGR